MGLMGDCGDSRSRWGGAVFFVVFCVAVWLGIDYGFKDMARNYQQTYQRNREEGAKAFRAGVPAEANPYKGSWRQGVIENARAWLDGWITAKEQAASAVRE
jgi:hypothetical protein